MTTYRNLFAHLFVNIVQSAFYQLSIVLLFAADAFGISSITTVMLSFLLFYIADDWRMIFHYSLALKGRILRFHAWQIWISNIAITILGLFCAFQLSLIALIVYTILSYVTWRLLLFVAAGVEGDMTVINAVGWRWFQRNLNPITGELIQDEKTI